MCLWDAIQETLPWNLRVGMSTPIVQAETQRLRKTREAAGSDRHRRLKSTKRRQTLGWMALGGHGLEESPEAPTPAGRVRGHKVTPKARRKALTSGNCPLGILRGP